MYDSDSPSVGKIIGLGLLTLVGVIVVAWMFGWIAVPFQTTSADNVREQWRFAYTYEESLKATASNVCSARKAVAAATSENEATQRRSQALAYEQNYVRIQAEYNARLRNAFEAKLVHPSDVPDEAPSLEVMLKRIGCS